MGSVVKRRCCDLAEPLGQEASERYDQVISIRTPGEAAQPEKSLIGDALDDIRSHRGLPVVVVTLALFWLAFQWGLGNDVVLPTLAARSLVAIDDGQTWMSGVAAVLVAGLAAFVFWSATQLLDCVVVLGTLRWLPRMTARFGRWVRFRGWVSTYDQMSWSTRWSIAYLAGASAVCLIDVFATGQPGIGKRWKIVAQTVLLSSGSVALVVLLIASAVMASRRFPSLEPVASVLLRFAPNPLTWLVVVGLAVATGRLRTALSAPKRS